MLAMGFYLLSDPQVTLLVPRNGRTWHFFVDINTIFTTCILMEIAVRYLLSFQKEKYSSKIGVATRADAKETSLYPAPLAYHIKPIELFLY